jgi:hypothetical protein
MGERPVGVSIGSLSKFFPQQEIEAILEASGRAGKRRRKLPALDLMYYLIALGLHSSEGCRSVLRRILLRRGAKQDEDVELLCSDSAISQARTRLGWQPLSALYQTVVGPIAIRSTVGAWYRRWRLVTLDGSTLDVADTKRNERAFGRPGTDRGKSAFPQLRFVTLLENGTHVLFGAEPGPYRTSEAKLARKVLTRLPADALCMADRYYFSYPLWKATLASGAALLWRMRENLILPKLKQLSDGSYLTKIYPSARARARDVGGIPARLITYRVGKGREEHRLLCSIMDPRKAPALQLVDLYRKRWTIETVLAELKTRLRGPRVVLRSRVPNLTRQDFWGLLLAHYGVRALMHEAALEEKIDPGDLSFTHAVRTIARYLPLYVSFFPSPQKEALQITLA